MMLYIVIIGKKEPRSHFGADSKMAQYIMALYKAAHYWAALKMFSVLSFDNAHLNNSICVY